MIKGIFTLIFIKKNKEDTCIIKKVFEKMKKVVFVLEETSIFVSSVLDSGTIAEMRFFDSITYVMLPLIKMCESLKKDKINFKFGITFSPIYCDMLSNDVLMKRYKEHLEKMLEFSKTEKIRLKDNEDALQVLEKIVEFIKGDLLTFKDIKGNILDYINNLERDGFIELLATSGSSAFLPIYKRVPNVVLAQVGIGKLSYKNYFPNAKLSGFCPPLLGFFREMDRTLKLYGYEYSLIAGSAFLLSKKAPETGVFAPSFTASFFKLLSTDTNSYYDFFFSPHAFSKNDVYLSNKKDIGYTLKNKEHLSPLFDVDDGRRITGFRYHAKNGKIYNWDIALSQAKKDAHAFIEERFNILDEVEKKAHLANPFSIMLIPHNSLGFKWAEGFAWLEEVFRGIDAMQGIETAFPREAATSCKECDIVEPFYSSLLESNYSKELFNEECDWIYRYIMKATERLSVMVNMFKSYSSLNERTLNHAAREVTLMQSAYWALFLNNKCYKEHAKKHFIELVKSFTFIYETLGAGMEETKMLTRREAELGVLKDIDYRLYKDS